MMSGSCNAAKSSHDHEGSMLHLRDLLEHQEKPNPSSQVSRAGVTMLPVGTVPENPLPASNLFLFLVPGRGAVSMGWRSCDSSTGHGDTGTWRYRYVGTWQHGCMRT